MPDFTTEFRKTTVQFLREYIGDEDKKIYESDDDLDIFLRNGINWGVYTERLTCFKRHFYSANPGPVLDLEITVGTAGATYLIDECTKHVRWVEGGTAPADNDTIEISYIDTVFFDVVCDVLLQIATDRSKLAIRAKIEGAETDLTNLRAEIMRQIAAIGAVEHWRR